MRKTNTKRYAPSFVYTGQENLEAMKEAKNYNRYLISLIENYLQPNRSRDNYKILDFGAGIGTYADMLLERGLRVDCLELDLDQISQLEQKGYKVFDGLERIRQKYNIIYAFNVFEHIENDIDVFGQLSKKLDVNGRVIIYVPAFPTLFSTMDKLVGHHRRYKLGRLKEMANTADLEVTYLGYAEPIGFLAALMYKLVGNKDGTITPKSVKLYDTFAFPFSRLLSPLFKYIFGKNALLVAQKRTK